MKRILFRKWDVASSTFVFHDCVLRLFYFIVIIFFV